MNDQARNAGQPNNAQRQRDDAAYHEAMLIGMVLKAPERLHDADPVRLNDLASHDYRIYLETLRFLDTARGGLTQADLPAIIEAVALRLRMSEADTAAMANALWEQPWSTANLHDFAVKVKRAALQRQITSAMQAGDARKVRDLVNEQDEIKERLKKPATPSRFIKLSAMGDRPPAVDWLIRDYLERDTITQLFGDPGSGKSHVALDMALSIAHGIDWRGRATARGPVFYLAGEGLRGLQRRKEAWLRSRDIEDRSAPFWLSTGAAALTDPSQHAALVNDMAATLKAAGETILWLIIVDTLARNFGNGDENSTQDMGAFIAALDRLRDRWRCGILLVHHSGHADKSRARGAMALLGSLDAEYRIEKIGDNTITLTSTKQKDNDPPPDLAWTVERYDLPWADEDGEPLNSAVLIPNETLPVARPIKEKLLTGMPKLALDALRELYQRQRETLLAGGQDPKQANVTISQWNDAMQNLSADKSYRSTVRRDLEKRGYVRFEAPYVHLTQNAI